MREQNIFKALAESLWARGEDGEQIARDLASAFAHVVHEGTNSEDKPGGTNPADELNRFLSEAF